MPEALPCRPWAGSSTITTTTTRQPMGLVRLEPGLTPAGVDSTENNGSSSSSMSSSTSSGNNGSGVQVQKIVSENAVIVFGRRGCCMSHVVQRLLLGLGANPAVFEVDDDAEEALLISQLRKIVGAQDVSFQFPVVFVGGEMFGGLERVMATHISGELVPILRQAGALWL
ncbi:Glutaredoxin-C9 [Ancistrocladus abbreviatus]